LIGEKPIKATTKHFFVVFNYFDETIITRNNGTKECFL